MQWRLDDVFHLAWLSASAACFAHSKNDVFFVPFQRVFTSMLTLTRNHACVRTHSPNNDSLQPTLSQRRRCSHAHSCHPNDVSAHTPQSVANQLINVSMLVHEVAEDQNNHDVRKQQDLLAVTYNTDLAALKTTVAGMVDTQVRGDVHVRARECTRTHSP